MRRWRRSDHPSTRPLQQPCGTPRWRRGGRGAAVWFHGDIAFGNLLVDDAGRLSAVIDFGTSGVGDSACDLVLAWTLLDGPARAAFRAALRADEAMWARARGWGWGWGWGLWKAMITLADPGAVRWHAESARVIDLVLAERSG